MWLSTPKEIDRVLWEGAFEPAPNEPDALDHEGAVVIVDFDEAVRNYHVAIENSAPASPEQAATFGDLGETLFKRYVDTGEVSALEASVEALEHAVEVAGESQNALRYLGNLSTGLMVGSPTTGE